MPAIPVKHLGSVTRRDGIYSSKDEGQPVQEWQYPAILSVACEKAEHMFRVLRRYPIKE
jgi:hypothetical protein